MESFSVFVSCCSPLAGTLTVNAPEDIDVEDLRAMVLEFLESGGEVELEPVEGDLIHFAIDRIEPKGHINCPDLEIAETDEGFVLEQLAS